MTESKEIMIPEYKESIDPINTEEIKEEPKKVNFCLPIVENEIKRAKSLSSNKQVDLIKKKRALKRWKQSFSYYCLHADKFKFSFKDLK